MPFDGTTLYSVAAELLSEIKGGRIDKIHQPSALQLRINIRTKSGPKRLLLSVSADSARIHITKSNAQNPMQPPMFCMLMRKLIGGGLIVDVRQYSLERIIEITIDARNELGISTQYILRHEIMGKHSNIILCRDDIIVDSLKRVDINKSRVRQIMPNIHYKYPPKQDKLDPVMMNQTAFHNLILSSKNMTCERALGSNILGLSNKTAHYISSIDMKMDVDSLSGQELITLSHDIHSFYKALSANTTSCFLIKDNENGNVLDFIIMDKKPSGDFIVEEFMNPSELIDEYYQKKDILSQLKNQTSSLMQSLKTVLKRTKRKLKEQQDILNDNSLAKKYKLFGELLTAYQGSIEKGIKEYKAINYYSENQDTITIPLDPEKTPNYNAQRYYKKYQKLTRAKNLAKEQIQSTRQELEYLESLEHAILSCGDLNAASEIQEEFISQGYIKRSSRKKEGRKQISSKPRHFISRDGYDIYVGRNNKQNDYLTMKQAKGNDMWMHTQKIPGSHVIISAKDNKVSDEALSEGALLAAYFSKARESSGVPVDYTLRKNVKKPNGAKPGYVIYLTHSTINITPKQMLIDNIKELK